MANDLESKKKQLDALRPFTPQQIKNLEAWYDVELTYTSNAIEGNTLTRSETAIVLEKGLTVRGKPLKDHQEAVDHLEALHFVRELAATDRSITERDVRDIHKLVVGQTLTREAGEYSKFKRLIVGSKAKLPDPTQIPQLMEEFGNWLAVSPPSPATAFEAHLRLVSIHPFSDGNGRTSRLLMNLLLLKADYPPVVIEPEQRADYFDSLEKSQVQGDAADYRAFMDSRLHVALDTYLDFFRPSS